MKLTDENIKKILLAGNYVTPEDIAQAESYAATHHTSIQDYLFAKELISKDLLGQATAEFFGVHYADLNSYEPSKEQVLRIPEDIAKKYHAVFLTEDQTRIAITTDSPKDPGLLKQLQQVFPGKRIVATYSLTEDIEKAFVYYRKSLEARFVKIISDRKRVAPEIIAQILEDALTYRASDIHFEPQEKEIVIRFRIDGVLNEAGRIAKSYYENILNRIKVQALLRIDEHMTVQDGAARITHNNQPIDLRVSIVPTVDGEKVVIRILSKYLQGGTLSDLGLLPPDQHLVDQASKKPFGMILVTGPTGSGKTTTLYTLLKILNKPEVNITTIEDPVEYKIAGVNHIQVNKETDLTFARGLRSIVRQDPDIILVGEIRDNETAEIAVNAALTGHLLLSTFHANDASSTIPRLLDMKIEPFLLASTLELIIAQRLVRRICDSCRYSFTQNVRELEHLLPKAHEYFSDTTISLYKGKGCGVCGNTGYKGRMAIFEIIRSTPELQDLLLTRPSMKQIWQLARTQGAHSLFEDGIEKVKSGTTTIDELMRIATPSVL